MRRPANGAAAAVLLLVVAGAVAPTAAQELTLRLESREVYAGLPFVLALSAEGFDEEPAPEAPELELEGCRVRFLGVSPSVSSGVRIINGRRSEWRRVSYTYRYRVEAPEAGTYAVPVLTVTQGDKRASTRPASFTVEAIGTTEDMRLRLVMPERPVWIGETFEVAVEWLLRRDVGDHSFVVPLFDLDFVQVQPGLDRTGRTLAFDAGATTVELPYTRDSVTENGTRYTRLRFSGLVTVNRAGPIELEPAKVAASLEAGTGRDTFGFRVPRYQLFKAEDEPRRLNVRPLPREGRPDSFENAIGTAFSIGVQASRTVVRVGDPLTLRIHIRGDGPLEGLSLPRLEGEGGLPPDLFSVPEDTVVGVFDPEGNGKTFEVNVRVKSAAATEIPPLEFSYFDPEQAAYRTIRSEPIALSVAGSAVVGAADVEAARVPEGVPADPGVAAGAASSDGATGTGAPVTLIGADLSLSAADAALRPGWAVSDAAPWIVALYVLPIAVLGVRVWQVRTRGRRGRARDLARAWNAVETELDSGRPARDAAPRIVAAVRALARLAGRESELATDALQQLETRAFDPEAGERPLPHERLEPVRRLVRTWVREARERAGSTHAAVVALLGIGVVASGGLAVRADDGDEAERLRAAREVYRTALEEPDRVLRTRKFGEAERLFAALVPTHPSSPDLLTDWGNAALGAQEVGRATLAYRRALWLDPNHGRARKNLAWLRVRGPAWLPRPRETGVLDSLFFWHHRLSAVERHLIGAAAFAGALLLLAPWSAGRARWLRRLALPLLLVWIATTGSALVEANPSRDAVVLVDATPLRSADSLGAPPALGNPLPAGAEVRILERRAAWTRVELADGTRGWVGSSTLEAVVP